MWFFFFLHSADKDVMKCFIFLDAKHFLFLFIAWGVEQKYDFSILLLLVQNFFFFFFNDCCQIIFGDLLRFWQRCQTLTLFDSVLRDNMVSQRWYLCLGRLPFCLSPWLSGWSHSPVSLISPTPLTWCPGFIKPSALTLSLSVCCCCCLISVLCVYASWLLCFFSQTCKSWTISDSCLCYMWVLLLPLVTTCLFVIRRTHSSGIYIHPQNAFFLTRCFSCDHGLCFPRMIY